MAQTTTNLNRAYNSGMQCMFKCLILLNNLADNCAAVSDGMAGTCADDYGIDFDFASTELCCNNGCGRVCEALEWGSRASPLQAATYRWSVLFGLYYRFPLDSIHMLMTWHKTMVILPPQSCTKPSICTHHQGCFAGNRSILIPQGDVMLLSHRCNMRFQW